MALIIHKDAQEHLKTLARAMDQVGEIKQMDLVYSLILNLAISSHCIDSGVSYPPNDTGCEGDPSENDLMVFRQWHDATDFYWVRWDKKRNQRNGEGGVNCHTQWFRDLVAGCKTNRDLWIELGVDKSREINWSINT